MAWSLKSWTSEVDALSETPDLQTMTSENVDANGNLFKKLLDLLVLGSDALSVSFEKLLNDSLYKQWSIMILSSPYCDEIKFCW